MKQVFLKVRSLPQRGQGMMEYIIIVAMIAVAAIGVYAMFGKTMRDQTSGLAHEIAGKKADEQIKAAGAAATSAYGRANENKGMSEYNKENDAK